MYRIRTLSLLLAVLLLSGSLRSQGFSWQKTFKASISNYPITLLIQKAGSNYSGYYYYEKTEQPIYLRGYDSTGQAAQVILYADDEIFTINLAGDSIYGQWQKETDAEKLALAGSRSTKAALNFDLIYTVGSEKLRAKKPESPEVSFSESTIWPIENTASALALKKFIHGIFESKNYAAPIGQVLLANKKAYIKAYLNENKNLADSDWVEYPSAYTLADERNVLLVYQGRRILTIADFAYSFTGGAHGNYGTSYTSFDLVTNKPIQLTTVLKQGFKKQLGELLAKAFRKKYKLKESDPLTEGGLFEDAIEATDNFYLTGKGIAFSYSPYEIGPYAMGEVVVFISYTELAAYLQPAFKTLLSTD